MQINGKGIFTAPFVQLLSSLISFYVLYTQTTILTPDEFIVFSYFIILANIHIIVIKWGLLSYYIKSDNQEYSISELSADITRNFIRTIIPSVLFLCLFPKFRSLENIILYLILVTSNGVTLVIRADFIKQTKFLFVGIYDLVSLISVSIVSLSLLYSIKDPIILFLQPVGRNILLYLFLKRNVNKKLSIQSQKRRNLTSKTYGLNLTLNNLIDLFLDFICIQLIGRYDLVNVGIFTTAKRLCQAPYGLINYVSTNILFPSLAKMRSKKSSLITICKSVIIVSLLYLVYYELLSFILKSTLYKLRPEWLGISNILKSVCVIYFAESIFSSVKTYIKIHKNNNELYIYSFFKATGIISIIFINTNVNSFLLFYNCSLVLGLVTLIMYLGYVETHKKGIITDK